MCHALDLPEILYNIFGHISPGEDRVWTYQSLSSTCALAKLARTCRAFKEPALDVLWSELPDISFLARCVPDAIRSKKQWRYAFKRPLTEAEWATVQSYARRVWCFLDCSLRSTCLEEESIAMLFNRSGGTLFPSLRFLSWGYGRPFPPLHTATHPLKILHLDCRYGDSLKCGDIIESVGNHCPLIMIFRLQLSRQSMEFDRLVSDLILRWSNLRVLECSEVALSADAILHLSRVSTLTYLSFALSGEVSGQILLSSLLVFPNLIWCGIASGRPLLVANFFARTRLPAIKELTVRFSGSPSKQTIRSLMTALSNACSSDTLTHLAILSQHTLSRRLCSCGDVEFDDDPITYDELRPCVSLGNLRSLKLDLEQPINLTDDLAELGSAWPYLEDLIINNDAGWRSTVNGGLTLHGLVRLLRACPALHNFSILLDTPTFTRIPEGMDASFRPRQFGRVNLVESPLGADMFSGVVDVFVAIKFSPRFLMAWRRVETDQRAPMGWTPTGFRSWRDLADEVKARIAHVCSESEDSK